VLTRVHGRDLDGIEKANLAWEFQEAVTEVLTVKALAAVRYCDLDRLVVAGGVGANHRLRQRLDAAAVAEGVRVYYPELALCTDNGAMIAYCGAQRLLAGVRAEAGGGFSVRPRWPLQELS
jgi:N6-L-threonylcarbamoyladenine synthase